MSIVHPLDPKDAAIFACSQAGCQECANALLEHHEGLVHYIVGRQYWDEVSKDDLLQEGRIGLWRAILGYDPGRGVTFSAYASVAIMRRIWRVTALERRRRRMVRQADPADAYQELEDRLWREQVERIAAEACRYLTDRQRQVLSLVYGIGGGIEPGTEAALGNLAAAGRELGISRERVRQLRNDALAVLRLPMFSVRLRKLCQQDSRDAYLHSRQLSRSWLLRKRGAE
jgi:RNA polymerase sigma factor (sigma-70 family)